MAIRTRTRKLPRRPVSAALIAAIVVGGLGVVGAAPAGANPGTLYSPTPLNGWGQDGTAYAVKIVGDTVYVGGSFANAVRFNQSEAHANLMAVQRSTGTVVSSFTASTDGTVRAVVSDGTYLYIAGDFTVVNGQPRSRVAKLKLDGTLAPGSFSVTSTQPVRDLLVVGNTLYLVGDFTKINGTTRKRAAAVNTNTGALTGFDPDLSSKTYAVAINPSGTRLYLGGNFATVGGTARSFLAEVNPTTGAVQGPSFAQLGDLILDLSVTDGQVFGAADGSFNSVAAWNPNSGARQWRQQANGDVQAVKFSNGNVYFGFHDGFGGNTELRVLAADAGSGKVEAGFQPVSGGNTGVLGIDADGDYLAVVGKFPKMGGFNVKGVSIHP